MPTYAIHDRHDRKAELVISVGRSADSTPGILDLQLQVETIRGLKALGEAVIGPEQATALVRLLIGKGGTVVTTPNYSYDMCLCAKRNVGFTFTLSLDGRTLRRIFATDQEVRTVGDKLYEDLHTAKITTWTAARIDTATAERKPIAGSPPGAPNPPFPT